MQTFVRIVEAGSLSAAAAQLAMSQPTVSRRLRRLEHSLGVCLVLRNTHGMQLTAAGKRAFARAVELLTDWQAFEGELRGGSEVPEGTLRVVAPHGFGQAQLMPAVVEFARRHPKVTVEWRLHDGPVRLIEDGIDCVIRVGAVKDESLVARKIYEVERIVVAPPGLAAGVGRPADLGALPWLALGTYYRDTVRLAGERGASAVVRIRPRLVTDSLYALRSAMLLGLGVAVMSRWIVDDDIAAGQLVHLLPR